MATPRMSLTKPRAFNFEVWALRVDAAEKADRKERLEKEKQETQAARFRYGSDKETAVMRRVMKASEGDSSEKRISEARLKAAAESEELRKEQAKWDQQYEETMKEVKPYL